MGDPMWLSGPIEREGMTRFLHLVQGPKDPERSGSTRAEKRGWADDRAHTARVSGRAAKDKLTVDVAARLILELLADGEHRTFNRICVELFDRPADVMFEGPADQAVWSLAAQGLLEFTNESPIYWRRRGGGLTARSSVAHY